MGLAMSLLLLSPTSPFAFGVAPPRRTAAIAAAVSGQTPVVRSVVRPSVPLAVGGGIPTSRSVGVTSTTTASLVRVGTALAAGGGGEPGSKRKRKRRRRPTASSTAAEQSPVGAVSPDPIKVEQERLEGLEPQGDDDDDDEEEDVDDDSVKEELLILRDVAKFEFKPDSDALIGASTFWSVSAQEWVVGRSIGDSIFSSG